MGLKANSPDIVAMIDSLPANTRLIVGGPTKAVMWVETYETGLLLSFNLPGGALDYVALFADGEERFNPYRGELPAGLRLGEPRGEVEKQLGAPIDFIPGNDGFETLYPQLGLSLSYGRPTPRDAGNPLVRFLFESPSAKGSNSHRHYPSHDGLATVGGFRLVVPEGSREARLPEHFINPSDGAAVYVSPNVIIDEQDVERPGESRSDNGRRAITLRLQPRAGAERLSAVSAANSGRQMAIILDQQLLIAPTIQDKMGADIVIDMGGKADDQKTDEVLRKLRRAIYTLPPEK